MNRGPRSLEEWLYVRILHSIWFRRFVQRVYNRVNGIKSSPCIQPKTASEFLYRPTLNHKFRAYRILFWNDLNTSIGFSSRNKR